MIAFEYETETYTGDGLTDRLNKRGAEGWLMTNMDRLPPEYGYNGWSYRIVWVRPKESPSAASNEEGRK